MDDGAERGGGVNGFLCLDEADEGWIFTASKMKGGNGILVSAGRTRGNWS